MPGTAAGGAGNWLAGRTLQLARISSPSERLSSFFARAASVPCFSWCQPAREQTIGRVREGSGERTQDW